MHELHKPVTQILHLITYDMEYKLKHQYLLFNEEQKKHATCKWIAIFLFLQNFRHVE